jgi:two-component system, cell cycle response regulator
MRILIVEDNPSDRELLLEALQEHFGDQAKFRETSDLTSAYGLLERGGVDCIVLDLNLPDSVGLDTFARIYAAYPHIPIIVMTHNTDLDLATKMIGRGAEDFVIKNYGNTTALFRRILFAIERNHRNQRRLMKAGAANGS